MDNLRFQSASARRPLASHREGLDHAALSLENAMAHYLLRLIPPRPTFATDMTEVERQAMSRHADYLRGLADKGTGVAFGPVFDPKGVWGLGILEVADEAEARAITDQDPAVIAGVGRYEIVPMRLGIMRKGLG
jgi:uncharacterized protein